MGDSGATRRVAILGSTGSIGSQALDVVRRHRDRYKVVALAAGSNTELLEAQRDEFAVPPELARACGRDADALAELAALPSAAVVVEQRYGALLNDRHTRPGWLLELVARLQVRYAAVPIVFADSRKLGEEYTYRFLAAALTQHAAT
jgi:hypothetical protein